MTRRLTVLAVAIGVLIALLLLPRLVDLRMNRVRHKPPGPCLATRQRALL